MNELCILQDDVPPFPNQVHVYCKNSMHVCGRLYLLGLRRHQDD